MTKYNALLLVLLFASIESSAELYKWTDESGKVHYSDKAPDTVEKQVINSAGNPVKKAYKGLNAKAPIIRPYETKSRTILISDVSYRWRKQTEINKVRKIGAYYMGRHCTPRGPIKLPQVYVNHSEFFPKESSLPRDIRSVAKGLGYYAEVVSPSTLIVRLDTSDGVNLHAEIFDIDLHSCAPVYNPAAYVSPKQLKYHRFNRSRIYLKVQWQLKEGRKREVVYETETSAFFDQWYEPNKVENVIAQAVRQATESLFAQEAFIEKIMTKNAVAEVTPTDNSESEPGFWSKYFPIFATNTDNSIQEAMNFGYKMKANATGVMVELTSIKMNMLNFYATRDHWPRRIEEIGLNSDMFARHKLISDIELDSHGTISATLREDVFGSRKMLQLSPNTNDHDQGISRQINWECYSNLDKSYLPENCEHI